MAPVLDGLSATTMDESLLRQEPLLWRYWTAVSWLSYKQSRAAITSRKSTLQVYDGFLGCMEAVLRFKPDLLAFTAESILTMPPFFYCGTRGLFCQISNLPGGICESGFLSLDS